MMMMKDNPALKKLIRKKNFLSFKYKRSASENDVRNQLVESIKKSILKGALSDPSQTVLLAANFEVIIEWVIFTCQEGTWNRELQTFLLTYRLFKTPVDLISCVKSLYTTKYASATKDIKEVFLSKAEVFFGEWIEQWGLAEEEEVGEVLSLFEMFFPASTRNIFKLKLLKLAAKKKLQSHSHKHKHSKPKTIDSLRSQTLPLPLLRLNRDIEIDTEKETEKVTHKTTTQDRGRDKFKDKIEAQEEERKDKKEGEKLKESLLKERSRSRGREEVERVDEVSSRELATSLESEELSVAEGLQPSHFLQHLLNPPAAPPESPSSTPSDIKSCCCSSHQSPLSNLAERFNRVSLWVATQILLQSEKKAQLKVLSKFIRTAKILSDRGNYQTLMQILSGINNVSVQRLKLEEGLSSKERETLDKLNNLMSPANNFKLYRKVTKALVSYFPHLAVVQRDLTFLSDGNPTYLGKDLINFEKLHSISNLISHTLACLQHYKKSDRRDILPTSVSVPLTVSSLTPILSSIPLVRANSLDPETDKEYEEENIEEDVGSSSLSNRRSSFFSAQILKDEDLYNLSLSFVPPQNSFLATNLRFSASSSNVLSMSS